MNVLHLLVLFKSGVKKHNHCLTLFYMLQFTLMTLSSCLMVTQLSLCFSVFYIVFTPHKNNYIHKQLNLHGLRRNKIVSWCS